MTLRNIITLLVAALLVVFTLQNATTTEVDFLIWHVQLPRAVVLLAVFAVGMLCGWAACRIADLRRQRGETGGD